MANIEEIKNDKNYHSVLDNGFVGLVDHMGTDESIVRAARVSYSKGTKSSRDSRGLIRYLVRHSHTSPLEMNEAIFHIKLPIFVMRQLVRHRTACLTGDNQLYMADNSRIFIKQFYDNWKNNVNQNTVVKMLNEETNEILSTEIVNIWSNGNKEVFELTLENDFTIKLTADHECLTNNGWQQLKNALNLEVEVNSEHVPVVVKYDDTVLFAVENENNSDFIKVKSIKYVGIEEVFDLTVKGPYHNFVANGLVVHNCLNEVSGRYSELTDEVYVPDLPQIKPQSLTNKQGRSGEFLPGIAQRIKNIFKKNAETSLQVYNNLLGNNHDFSDLDENYPGLARELARGVLTVNHYTELYWKMDLHNLLHFIRLREDSHAQWEIQEYARAILELIRPLWPITIEAWEDYIKNASKLSRMDQELLNTVIKTSNEFNMSFNFALDKLQGNLSNKEFAQTLGMSEREYVEWKEKFIKED
jgi:flavin-dependent thymidylate synthase